MLQRAVAILEKEIAGAASIMQLQSTNNLAQALTIMAKASAISADRNPLHWRKQMMLTLALVHLHQKCMKTTAVALLTH